MNKKTRLIILAVVLVVAAAYALQETWLKGAGAGLETRTLPDAPDVVMQDLEGNDVRLAQFRGQVVLLNFWATWCGPCRIEIPWFIEFQRKYAGQGFTVLGMAMDDNPRVVAPWLEKERFDVDGQPTEVNYPMVIGNDDLANRFGGIIGLPTTLVISRDGKIAKRFIGLVNHRYIQAEIEKQLAMPAPATSNSD